MYHICKQLRSSEVPSTTDEEVNVKQKLSFSDEVHIFAVHAETLMRHKTKAAGLQISKSKQKNPLFMTKSESRQEFILFFRAVQ